MRQYWADAATKNCVWLFQTRQVRYGENGCTCGTFNDYGEKSLGQECTCAFEYWKTDNVFLTMEEAMTHGKARPYAWGEYQRGWRVWGVMCVGLMAELLGKHVEEFKDKVEYISKVKEGEDGNE